MLIGFERKNIACHWLTGPTNHNLINFKNFVYSSFFFLCIIQENERLLDNSKCTHTRTHTVQKEINIDGSGWNIFWSSDTERPKYNSSGTDTEFIVKWPSYSEIELIKTGKGANSKLRHNFFRWWGFTGVETPISVQNSCVHATPGHRNGTPCNNVVIP